MNKALLIVFVKNIVLGKVKTRLAKSIGDVGAFNVYKQLFNITQTETLKTNIERHIYFSDVVINSAWPNDKKFVQSGNNIGERMENAFNKGFELGYKKVILIGSDLPDISSKLIQTGIELLNSADCVFGPATDGGYYLIGLNEPNPHIFRDKPWSKPNLMSETETEIYAQDKSIKYLKKLNDIDTIDDLNKSSLDSEYKTK